jgi:hypothetical protein
MKFDFRGTSFDFTGADDSEIQSLYESQIFQRWLASLDASLTLLTVELQSVVRARDGRLTWLKISTVTERNGGRIPRILILDGRHLAVVVLINGESLLLVEKPRIATGNFQCEIPSGSTKEQDPSPELAARILFTECGLHCKPADFVNLLAETVGKADEGLHPYCGPCDRQVFLYALRLTLEPVEIAALEGKEIAPNVHLRIAKLAEVGQTVNDFLGLSAILFLRKFLETK